MPDPQEDFDDLHWEIIAVLREGRATPAYLMERCEGDHSRQVISYRLRDLRMAGVVEKVHKGLYELVEDPGTEEEPGSETEAGTSEDSKMDEILNGWNPGRSEQKQRERKKAAKAVLEFLRERGEATKSDIIEACYPEKAPEGQNEDTYWQITARGKINEGTGGALALGLDAGVIERQQGPPHIYRWVGD